MNTLVFCLLCFLQLLDDVVSLDVKAQEVTIYSKVGAKIDFEYSIHLDESQSINEVTIVLATAKTTETSFEFLASITFQNGEPILKYFNITETNFMHNRFNVDFKDFKVKLTISNIIAEDFDRKYSCTAELGFESPSKTIELKEATPPTISTSNLFLNNHTEIVELGSKDINFLCDASGIPTPNVRWDKVTYLGEFIRMKQIGTGGSAFLHFDTFNREDNGGYRCTASNEGGSVSKTFFIFPGYIEYEEGKSTTETISLNIDETFRTVCPITGNPEATYVWQTNGTVLTLDSTFVYAIKNNNDFTNYTCIASNQFGKLYYTVVVKNAESVSPTVEGVNKDQISSSTMNRVSAIFISLLHLVSISFLYVL